MKFLNQTLLLLGACAVLSLSPVPAAAQALDDLIYTAADEQGDDGELIADQTGPETDPFANVDTGDGPSVEAAAAINDPQMSDEQKITELAFRFLMNLLACWIIVGVFYYRKARRRDYYFTFLVFSVAMLLLLSVMGKMDNMVGLTLGLFAIFGVIRYRTETVPIREMTYLFVIIALAAMNGLAPLYGVKDALGANPHYALLGGNVVVIGLANLLVILVIAVLESGRVVQRTTSKLVLYDRIELIVPEKRDELIADLEKRLGLKVIDVEIGHVDFLKDAAFIKVFYKLAKGENNTINTLTRAKDYVG